MNRNYFNYLVRNRKVALIFFFAVYLGISLISFISNDMTNLHARLVATETSITTSLVLSVILTYALPVLQLSYVHSKRSVDLFFALPVSRKEQIITNIVFMCLVCGGFYTVVSLAAWLVFGQMALGYMFYAKYLALGLVFILTMIIINSTMYLLANNAFDGIVMIGAYTALPYIVYAAVWSFAINTVAGYTGGRWADTVQHWLSPLYINISNIVSVTDPARTIRPLDVILLILWTGLAVYGLKKNFTDRKAERAEQVSDSFFAYPFIINSYALCVLTVLAFEVVAGSGLRPMLVFYILLFLIYFVAMFVYRRKIRPELKYFAAFGIGTVLTLALAAAAWHTRGFGLAEKYSLTEGDYLVYSYHLQCEKNDLAKPMDTSGENWEAGAEVSVTVTIPVEKMDEYRPLIDMFETHRRGAIDRYYADNTVNYGRSRPYLEVYNSMDPFIKGDWFNAYRYYSADPLSLDELKLADRYGDVSIYTWYEDGEYTLEEYLEGE